MNKQTNKQTNTIKQTDRQTNKKTNKQNNKQTNKNISREVQTSLVYDWPYCISKQSLVFRPSTFLDAKSKQILEKSVSSKQ